MILTTTENHDLNSLFHLELQYAKNSSFFVHLLNIILLKEKLPHRLFGFLLWKTMKSKIASSTQEQ